MKVRFTVEWKGNWEFDSGFLEMQTVPCIGDTICTEDFFKGYKIEDLYSKYKLEPFLLVFDRVFFKDAIEISLRDPYEQQKQQQHANNTHD